MTHPVSVSSRGRFKLQMSKLAHNPKCVLLVLLAHYNDRTHQCNPSLARIMACADLSRNTVRNALKQLEAWDLIDGHTQQGSRTKQWDINFAGIEALPPAYQAAPKSPAPSDNKPLKDWSLRQRPEALQPKTTTQAEPQPTVSTETATVNPSHSRPLPADTIQRINAQRRANGKRSPIYLSELQTEARKAGISPAQAADWILAKPSRNFFKADYWQAENPPTAAPTPKPDRNPTLRQLEQEQQNTSGPSAEIRAQLQRIINTPSRNTPRSAQTPQPPHPAANTDWAKKIVDRYLQGQAVSYASIHNAAQALGTSVGVLKAKRAAGVPVS